MCKTGVVDIEFLNISKTLILVVHGSVGKKLNKFGLNGARIK